MKLNFGAGKKKIEGYKSVDCDARTQPDYLIDVNTSIFPFEKNSCEEIVSYHFFEHLDRFVAIELLRKWQKILKPGGVLVIECPNLLRCCQMMFGDEEERRLGMIGIYGYEPDIVSDGIAQVHKSGWTPASIENELHRAGFRDVYITSEVDQSFREAYKYKRDMKVSAVKKG